MSGYGTMGGEGLEGKDKLKNELAQKTGEVMDQAKEQTEQVVEKVRGNAFQAVDQQKHRAAEGLGSVAQALRQTGESLHGADQGALGQYAERAAEAIEQFSGQLQDKSVEELMYEAERFARREPELFLGGAVLLGLLASRFLKASARRSQMRNQGEYGYSGQYGSSYSGQGQYGSGMGRSSYERGTWGGENIGYRSAGTGGYRTTSIGSESGMSSGAAGFGNERTNTVRRQQPSGSTGSANDGSSLRHDEEGSSGFNAGSSQA